MPSVPQAPQNSTHYSPPPQADPPPTRTQIFANAAANCQQVEPTRAQRTVMQQRFSGDLEPATISGYGLSSSDRDKLQALKLDDSTTLAEASSMLKATLVGSRTAAEGRTLYILRCSSGELPEWDVERSYSEFDDLYNKLSKAGLKLSQKMPPKHWTKGSDHPAVVAERKAGLPAVIQAIVPLQVEVLSMHVLEFLRVNSAWDYWRLRGKVQIKCASQENQLKKAEQESMQSKDKMREDVARQEAETSRITKEATQELERMRRETDAKIHQANLDLEKVRQERFLVVAGKQSQVATLKQTLEETHQELSILAKRVPPLLEDK
eukprot:TRINITY_DN51595_c0_g2_i2.p1 TRINITY_DN51595_c0_g2~~TRINITY_DN51595_c0_g2_i2.p1  ORF type:complete len:322 (+),score=60.04 TRINITY_DN51595_c0_g2_i2:267-1232(+)